MTSLALTALVIIELLWRPIGVAADDIQSKRYIADDYTEWWDVNTRKGVMKQQYLRFRKINFPGNVTTAYSTCYEATCSGRSCGGVTSFRFCYPSVIVTGLPKCGTTAMYDLLSRFPGVVKMAEKENCPYARRRPHWNFLLSLPRYESVAASSLIIDGCIEIQRNLLMRELLRQPKTLFVVMTRDYPEMLWSSYNFWCHYDYDGITCEYGHWVVPGVHRRSPELFHEMVQGDVNGTKILNPMHGLLIRPCHAARNYFSNYMTNELWNSVSRNTTLVIASEELESNPESVWKKVAHVLHMPMDKAHVQVGNFQKFRFNSQEFRGAEGSAIAIEKYRPGVFNASGFLPILPSTRATLEKCWLSDCILTSQLSGHLYPSCINESLALIRAGGWRSFNEIYRTNREFHNHTGIATWDLEAKDEGKPLNPHVRLY